MIYRSISAIVCPRFRDLYRWRDGQDSNEFSNFDSRNNMMLMCLAEVKNTLQDMRELLHFGDIDERIWSTTWIPYLSNGGNHLCLDFSRSSGELPVIYHDHKGPDGKVIAPSLEQWLQQLLDDYNNISEFYD